MEVRPPASTEDARGAAAAHNCAWRAAYDDLLPEAVLSQFDPDPDGETVRGWHERFREEAGPTLVATVDGAVVGYAVFRVEDTKAFVGDDEAGLKEIYVHPDHWGEGVGTALLEEGIDRLPDGLLALKLEVFADNDVGRRFYEARGFDRVGDTDVEVAGEVYAAAVYALSL